MTVRIVLSLVLLSAMSLADGAALRPGPELLAASSSGAVVVRRAQGRTGVPLDPASVLAAATGDARPVGTPSPAVAAPEPASTDGRRPGAERPTPSGASTLAPASGIASWFDAGLGLYAAVLGFRWGQRPYPARVCGAERCVVVRVRGCLCGRDDRLVDLSPEAFRAVCGPLSKGICVVTMEEL